LKGPVNSSEKIPFDARNSDYLANLSSHRDLQRADMVVSRWDPLGGMVVNTCDPLGGMVASTIARELLDCILVVPRNNWDFVVRNLVQTNCHCCWEHPYFRMGNR